MPLEHPSNGDITPAQDAETHPFPARGCVEINVDRRIIRNYLYALYYVELELAKGSSNPARGGVPQTRRSSIPPTLLEGACPEHGVLPARFVVA